MLAMFVHLSICMQCLCRKAITGKFSKVLMNDNIEGNKMVIES